MAPRGPLGQYRRWRRKRMTHAPRPWIDSLSTAGIILLVVGAALIALYVARLR